MRLAIFEPNGAGHHMIYVRHIASQALRRGWKVHLVTSEASLSHLATQEVLGSCEGLQTSTTLSDIPFPTGGGMMGSSGYQLRQFANFARGYKSISKGVGPDFIYCVNFDYFNRAMAVRGAPFGSTPFGGMLMRVRFHHREFGVATPAGYRELVHREFFYRMLGIARLRLLTTCDELLLPSVRRFRPEYAWKLAHVPEMSSVRIRSSFDCARKALGIAPDRFVVLAYGALSIRKGIAELLAAAAHPGFPANATVLLAGAPSEELAPLMKSPAVEGLRRAGRLKELPWFLDAAMEYNAFRAADVVWLGYRGHYESSAVIVQAASMGVPVVACDEGLIAWWARNYDIGEIVRVTDTESVIGAIARLATDKELRHRYSTNGLAIASRHSPEVFSATVCDAIANALKGTRSRAA